MNATPAQEGHAGLPVAADRAAGKVVAHLARRIGHKAAVAWVHTGAVLAWMGEQDAFPEIGPADTAGGMRGGLKQLADIHPALGCFTDPDAVAVWQHDIGDEDATAIRELWVQHPLTDPENRPHGYLLGNAYQALSEESRKQRALAQTPRCITSLLLDLAFEPAAAEHGTTRDFRMIDPACGTGHILIETLIRASSWRPQGRAGQPVPGSVERGLQVAHGVDLDPYAAALARLRLVVLATVMLRANRRPGVDKESVYLPHDWPINVSATNALLDRDEPLLQRGRYHVVVTNPPYVTPKTETERNAVRAAYPEVCNGKYALSLPFHQLSTELLVPGGWCSQLTANSFMKREFGKKFVEQYLTGQDLRWVIDTSGAYIPGHGTPTLILVHRNQPPSSNTITAVRGNQGEPKTPEDPSRGLVWRAIETQVHEHLAYQRLAAAVQRETRTAHDLNLIDPDGQANPVGRTRDSQTPVAAPAPAPPAFEQPSIFDLLDEAA